MPRATETKARGGRSGQVGHAGRPSRQRPGAAGQRPDPLAPVEAEMRRLVDAAQAGAPPGDAVAHFYGMLRYHLGWVDADFAPDAANAGKRLRPLLLLRCAEALGAPAAAPLPYPAAAAVELLHNFTLVHDDIQDESSHRRHRETVWRRWGAAQAINVGDALFAVAHGAVFALAEPPYRVDPTRVLSVAREFDGVALRIVEGQYLDLAQEGRWDGGVARYLATIEGKTAAIMAFAARTGAFLAGADEQTAALFARFGLALGLAFQVRDDILGIWGAPEVTGKPAADDLRRRKQSLPVVALDELAAPAARDELRALYRAPRLDEAAVARVLALFDAAGIEDYCQDYVARYHDEARALLDTLTPRLARTDHLRDFLVALEDRRH